MGPLVREERLDEQPIVKRDVDDDADGRRAIEIDGLAGDALVEVAAEAVSADGGDLDGLGRGDRRGTRGRCREQGGDEPSSHAPCFHFFFVAVPVMT